MVLGEAIAGLGAIKTAFDMAKALESIHETVERDRAVIDLQREILSAQQAQFALVERVRDLEKAVTAFEKWEAEKQRYELKELPPGVFVRVLKLSMADTEPTHRLCSKCYEDGKKSILQSGGTVHGEETLHCHGCGARMKVGIFQAPPPQNVGPSWVRSRRG